jgi:hypothetical protein
MKEARSEVGIGLGLDRQFTIASFCAAAWSDNPAYLAQRMRLMRVCARQGVHEG